MPQKLFYTRDSQKTKSYKFEYACRAKWNDECRITQAEANLIAREVWSDYFISPERDAPRVIVTGRKKKSSSFYIADWQIKLADGWGACKSVLLHEVAHAIIRERYRKTDRRVAAHGPEFVSVLIDLWTQYMGRDYRELTTLRISKGVRAFPSNYVQKEQEAA